MTREPFSPIHPGEIIDEEFLKPIGLEPARLAEAMQVGGDIVEALVRDEGRITGDLALRLERALGSSAQFWLNLQSAYDLDVARDRANAAELDAIPRINPIAAE